MTLKFLTEYLLDINLLPVYRVKPGIKIMSHGTWCEFGSYGRPIKITKMTDTFLYAREIQSRRWFKIPIHKINKTTSVRVVNA